LPREHQTRVPCRECSADCAKETVAFAKRKPIYSARLRKQAVDVDFGPCADVDLAVGDSRHGELDRLLSTLDRWPPTLSGLQSRINNQPSSKVLRTLEGWSQSFRCCGSGGWNRERSKAKLLAKPCWHDSGTGGLPRCREGPAQTHLVTC
jgi:hypothetical protein